MHDRVAEAVTGAHVAAVSVVPVSSKRDDDPVDVMFSEKVTEIATEFPTEYAPDGDEDVTPVTVGVVLSTTNVLLDAVALALPARSVPAIATVAVPSPLPTVWVYVQTVVDVLVIAVADNWFAPEMAIVGAEVSASENVAVNVTVAPDFFGVADEYVNATVGAVVSTMMFAAVVNAGRVSTAELFDASLMVPEVVSDPVVLRGFAFWFAPTV